MLPKEAYWHLVVTTYRGFPTQGLGQNRQHIVALIEIACQNFSQQLRGFVAALLAMTNVQTRKSIPKGIGFLFGSGSLTETANSGHQVCTYYPLDDASSS